MRFTSILAAVVALAATLSAQTTGGTIIVSPPVFPPPSYPELKQYLNLTDAQVASLLNILQQKAQAQQQINDQLSQKYQTLQTLLQSVNPNPTTVGQTMIDIQNLQKQTTPSTEPYHTQALAVLTQSQTALLANLNTALQLQTAAYEAVSVNLLVQPGSEVIGVKTPIPLDITLPGAVVSGPSLPRQ